MKQSSQLLLAAVVVALVSGGVLLLFRQSAGGSMEVSLPTATPPPVLKVYISGAVVNPGVYQVRQGDRLVDLIVAAGGATADADLEAVNLAARLRDADHWRIPRVGEAAASRAARGIQGGAGANNARIDLNSATPELLETLPGIGRVKAEAIVAYREVNGPFSSVEELLEVRGIGPSTLEAIRDLVEVR